MGKVKALLLKTKGIINKLFTHIINLLKKISKPISSFLKNKVIPFLKGHKKLSIGIAAGLVVLITTTIFLFALLGGESPPNKEDNESLPPPTGLILGNFTNEVSMLLDSNGGFVEVNNSDSKINGFSINVPVDAYDREQMFEIKSYTVESHTYGSLFNPITPLISVNNGGRYSQKPLFVDIPIDIADTEFAMAFYYDLKTGKLEAIPTTDYDGSTLTLGLKHFSDIIVSKITISELEALVFTGDAEDIEIDTGFRPSFDDWQFPNYGSSVTKGGNCAGQSLTMMWYYSQIYLKESQAPRLNNLFDNNGLYSSPNFWVDDSDAYRFVSKIQNIQDFNTPEFYECINYSLSDHKNAFFAFAYAMLVTESPQFITVFPDQGIGHAMVVYGIDDGNLLIADPNFPGVHGRSITFNPNTNLFEPYCSGTNAYEPNSVFFTKMIFTASSALIDYDYIESEYNKMLEGNSGNDLFPQTKVEVLTDYDQLTGAETWEEGIDFNLGSAYNDKLLVDYKNHAFIKFSSVSPSMAATFFNGENQPLFEKSKRVDSDGICMVYIPIFEGQNRIGILIEEIDLESGEPYYVHFYRVNINYTLLDAESTIYFETNGGNEISPATAIVGSTISPPENPTKTGYNFYGWYKDKTLIEPFVFDKMPSKNITIYAAWQAIEPPVYTIEFNLNGGTFTQDGGQKTQLIQKGGNATLPSNPTKNGYAFVCWNPAPKLENIQNDVVYIAQWIKAYTISFDLAGGNVHSDYQELLNQAIPEGGDALMCVSPSRDGFIFTGWSPAPNLMNVSQDLSYTAQWEVYLYGTEGLSYELLVDGTYEVSLGSAIESRIVIMDYYGDQPVTKIKDEGFKNNQTIEYVHLSPNIKTIGKNAFRGCMSLKHVFYETPCALEEIDDEAFSGCSELLFAPVPPSLLRIGKHAFYSCSKLSALSSTMWSGQLREIDDFAFFRCRDFQDGNLSKFHNLETIGEGAFASTDINYISLPPSITLIGLNAFIQNDNLSGYGIGLTPATQRFFNKNPAIAHMYAANGGFLDECDSYNVIDGILYSDDIAGNSDINDSTTLIHYPASHPKESFRVPTYVKTIGDSAFINSKIKEINIPRNVEKIESFAFAGSDNLLSISIPASVTEMGSWIFYECDNLTIYVEAESKPTGWANDWNASQRPVVWGCKMSDKNQDVFVISVDIKGNTFNNTSGQALNPPSRINYSGYAVAQYAFYGWFSSLEFADTQEVLDITQSVIGNTVYAAWTRPYTTPIYTITFDVNGGNFVSGGGEQTQNVKKYTPIIKPVDPEREGWLFAGWFQNFNNISTDIPVNFDFYPQKSATYFAKWIREAESNVTITFNSNGGSPISPITAPAGQSISQPQNPVKADYAFIGWYTDTGLNTVYNFTVMPEEDITLYAKWDQIIEHAGIYDLFMTGSELFEIDVDAGEYNYIQLNSDGTSLQKTHRLYYPDHNIPGTWTVSDNVITITEIDGTYSYTYIPNSANGTVIVSIAQDIYDTPYTYKKR